MTTKLHLFAASTLETISSTGTDIAAGTLLASIHIQKLHPQAAH